jgi:N-acetylmuramoyl-L-alanine amidase
LKKLFLLCSVVTMFFCSVQWDTARAQTSQKVICIDAGHQRHQNSSKEPIAPGSKVVKMKTTSGTQGVKTRKPEYVLNLEVALQLQKSLKAQGYKVYMTRTKHDVNISNVQRAQYCNKKKADLTIRIHADGSTNRSKQGLQVLYPSRTSTKKINTTSKKAAMLVLDELKKSTRAKTTAGGLTPRSDLTGFNWSTTPVILVEMGFMSNPTEDQRMATSSYQQKLVKGMVNGINRYFK